MITLDGIDVVYKSGNRIVHALKGVTLNIEQGEIFGILGRPGAGKSALIRCMNLLNHPTSGHVVVNECNLTSLSTEALRQARRNIGMIFQHFNLMDTRSVFDNVALPLELLGTPKAEIDRTVRSALELTYLNDKICAYPHQLSSGQKQQVAIARALVQDPKILLCEEATASLDGKTAHFILQLLNEINEQLNITLVMITHELEVIKSICHRVAILHQGEIVEQCTVPELFAHPKSLMGKEFIKTASRLDLPTAIRRSLRAAPSENHNPVFRLSFANSVTQEPLLAYVIQQFGLTINILLAHRETIHGSFIGILLIEMIGDKEAVQKALHFFEHKDIHIEVLGYVPRSV